MFHADNCYFLPDVEIVGRVCRTHHVSHTAFRGFGGPQGMVVIEEILDRIARTLALPPEVVRERNFYAPGDTTHYGQAGARRRPHPPHLERASATSADFDERRARDRRVQRAQRRPASAAWR